MRREREWQALRADWEAVKLDCMLELQRRKYAHPHLARGLLALGEAPLIELNAWGDRIWGMVELAGGEIEGRNLLGEALMQVRAELPAPAA